MITISRDGTHAERDLFQRWNEAVTHVGTIVITTTQELEQRSVGEVPDIQISLALMNSVLSTLREIKRDADQMIGRLEGTRITRVLRSSKVYWTITVVNALAVYGGFITPLFEVFMGNGNTYVVGVALLVAMLFHTFEKIKSVIVHRQLVLQTRINDLRQLTVQGTGVIQRVEGEVALFLRMRALAARAHADRRELEMVREGSQVISRPLDPVGSPLLMSSSTDESEKRPFASDQGGGAGADREMSRLRHERSEEDFTVVPIGTPDRTERELLPSRELEGALTRRRAQTLSPNATGRSFSPRERWLSAVRQLHASLRSFDIGQRGTQRPDSAGPPLPGGSGPLPDG